MKKIFFCLIVFFGFETFAFTQYSGPVTNKGSNTRGYDVSSPIITVAQAQKMRDDEWVVLKGKIDSRIYSDKYWFSDDTGKIVVDIDHDKWRGVTVTPNDIVIIRGEVDKDFGSNTEIDVKSIELAK